MRLSLVMVFLAGCRTISDAPPGTPPLVVEHPRAFVTQTLRITVKWEASCTVTSSDLSLTTRSAPGEHALGASITSSSSTVACNKQAFTARASCVPGPCTVVSGLGGTSRLVEIAFGRPGRHRLTLEIESDTIRKTWTEDIDVMTVDAVRIGCSTWDGETQRPCDGLRFRPGAMFSFTADAYAAGNQLAARPTLVPRGMLPLSEGRWQATAPGQYDVHAEYDGVIATMAIIVEP